MNILNGGSIVEAINCTCLEGADLAEHAASWAADDLPDTQEPYGGCVESRALADKKKESRDSGGSKGPGRPTKMGQLLKAS